MQSQLLFSPAVQTTEGQPTEPQVGVLARLCVLLIGLLALAIQYPPPLLNRPLDIDETVTHWVVDARSPGTFWQRATEYSATPPGYFACLKLWLTAVPVTEGGYRSLSLLCHAILTVAVGIWVTGRAGVPAGVLATVLVASHPLLRAQAVMARPYVPGVLATWTAFTGAWTVASGKPGRGSWILWLASNAALLWCHYLFALAFLPQLVIVASGLRRRRVSLTSLLGTVAVLVALCLPLAPAVTRLWMRRQYLNWSAVPSPWSSLFGIAFPWLVLDGSAVRRAAVGLCIILAGLAAARLVWTMRRKRAAPPPSVTGFVVFGLGLLPLLSLWVAGRAGLPSLATSRYTTPALPLISAGLALILAPHIPRPLVMICAISFPVAQGGTAELRHWFHRKDPAASHVWQDPRRWTAAGWKAACLQLRDCNSADYLLVSSGLAEQTLVPVFWHDRLLHDYVSCRATRFYMGSAEPRRIAVPATWDPQTIESLLQRLRGGIEAAEQAGLSPPRVYVVCATDTDVLRARADATYRILTGAGWNEVDRQSWHGVELRVFQRR